MANPNYVLLERITVGEAGAASVTFNNIPQSGYTDLKIVVSARTNYASNQDNLNITFNNSTTGYSEKTLLGTGSAAASYNSSNPYIGWDYCAGANATANTFGNLELYIPNYTSSNYKSISMDSVEETNATAAYSNLTAGLWSNTAAITIVKFTPNSSSSLVQYSTFSLYGLAAVGTTPVIAPYASGGDIIETDGTYWYHAFLSSGTFTPAKALSCDVLVVAGGGGGGNDLGGGGGAGGLLALTSQALTSNVAQTVTIGAGGATGATVGSNGFNGSNSIFGSNTAIGGGGGQGASTTALTTGGSGGGGTYNGTGGSATSGQGYAGGNGASGGSAYAGGGGGGAGGAGGVGLASSFTGGAGGVGYYSTLTDAVGSLMGLGVSDGTHYYFAGGGGGDGSYPSGAGVSGVGGKGGGGTGGRDTSSAQVAATAGTPNTGGGGGGGTWDSGHTPFATAGAKGGSGIVIVRYAI